MAPRQKTAASAEAPRRSGRLEAKGRQQASKPTAIPKADQNTRKTTGGGKKDGSVTKKPVCRGRKGSKKTAKSKAKTTKKLDTRPGSAARGEEQHDPDQAKITGRFKRSDLERHGALELIWAQLPTLNTRISPIWHYDRFTFLGQYTGQAKLQAYAAIMPALSLATHWITETGFESFWPTLWFPQSDGFDGEDDETPLIVAPAPELAEQHAGAITSLFEELAQQTEWESKPFPIDSDSAATHARIDVGWPVPTSKEKANAPPTSVTLQHDDLRWLTEDPHNNPTASVQLRFFFHLAVKLVRELVWHVFRHQWRVFHQNGEDVPDRSKVLYQLGEVHGYSPKFCREPHCCLGGV